MSRTVSMMNERHALECELAAEVLRSYGTLKLQVTGWSMFPTVCPHDILIVDSSDMSAIAQGDIVLFGRDRRLFAHRVVTKNGLSGFGLLTRGDAMPTSDPPVSESELLGKVSFVVRNGRYIRPPRRPRASARFVGMLVHRSKTAARVIAAIYGIYQASQVQTA